MRTSLESLVAESEWSVQAIVRRVDIGGRRVRCVIDRNGDGYISWVNNCAVMVVTDSLDQALADVEREIERLRDLELIYPRGGK